MIAFLGTALYFLFEATAALSSGDGERTNKVDLYFGVFISQESAFDFSGFIPPLELGVDVLPHMRILAHTRMGRPIRVWANIMSHTRMGVPYEYACMIVHSCTTCTPGINFYLLTKYYIVYYKNIITLYS